MQGFPELLLDRSAERNKDVKDAKYFVICCLVESGDAANIVGRDVDMQLREYVSARVFKEDGSRRPGSEAGGRKGGDGRDGRKDGRVEEGLSNNASSAQLLKVIVNT